jgi:hypothetical protein
MIVGDRNVVPLRLMEVDAPTADATIPAAIDKADLTLAGWVSSTYTLTHLPSGSRIDLGANPDSTRRMAMNDPSAVEA